MRQYRFINEDFVPNDKIIPLVVEFIPMNLEQGRRVTSEQIILELKQNNFVLTQSTLIRKMKRWGFSWGKLLERDVRRRAAKNIEGRQQYLQNLDALAKKGYDKRIYLDESYVNENHSFNEGWYISSEYRRIFKKSGPGKRIAMVGAVANTRWLGIDQKFTDAALKKKNHEGIYEYKSIAYWDIAGKKKLLRKTLEKNQTILIHRAIQVRRVKKVNQKAREEILRMIFS